MYVMDSWFIWFILITYNFLLIGVCFEVGGDSTYKESFYLKCSLIRVYTLLVTAVICVVVITGGLWPLPQVVNFNFEKKTAKVQSIKDYERWENIWRNEGVVSKTEKEEIKSSFMDGPLLKIGDEIEFYDIPGFFTHHLVLKYNGNDIREIYGRPIIEEKESNGAQKKYLILYIVLFSISHGFTILITKKKYNKRIKNNNYFQVGRFRETTGRLIWIISSICYILLLLVVLIGIGNGIWVSIFVCITFLAVHIGFLIVTIYRNAYMIYNSQNIQIRYVNGCFKTYQLSDISEITEKKTDLFLLRFSNHKTYVWIRNEKQKNILNEIREKIEFAKEELRRHGKEEVEEQDIARLNPNIKVLKEMDVLKSQKYLIYKEAERNDATDGTIIIVGIIGLIAVIVLPFFMKELSRWTIVGIILGLIVLMLIWKKVRKSWDDLQDNVCQYVQIKMHYEEEMEFRCSGGKIINHTFQNEIDIEDGDEVYVIYVPEINKVFAETMETMKDFLCEKNWSES